MPNLATINGVAENDIATYNGANVGTVSSKGGATWDHTPVGGTITTDGDYKVHTFTSSGTFTITDLSLVLSSQVEYLVIGSGAGGGHYSAVADGLNASGASGIVVIRYEVDA